MAGADVQGPTADDAFGRLHVIANQSQACEIVMNTPGVGVQKLAAFASAVYEAATSDIVQCRAYFGLAPRRHQSGELDWTGRIIKKLNGTVRKLFYEAVNSVLTRSREKFPL